MKEALVAHLACPACASSLDLDVNERGDGEIRTGVLRCSRDGRVFPVTRFIPRFVDADTYADSFSRQRLYVRQHFQHYGDDRSGDTQFLPTTGFTAEQIRAALTLDVGCGYGRFVDVVERMGGRVVGVDLSTHSIDLAHDFVGLRPNVHLVQADLFHLPFRREVFDQAYAIGVLHHTPDTGAAFHAILPYIRHGGQIAVWVYHPSMKVSVNRWRRITTRLPPRWVYGWCIVNQVLFSWIRALPGGGRFSRLIPGAAPGQPFWMRVLSDFDDLSPRFAHVHTPEEVRQWFEEAGLEEVRMLDRKTAVCGRVSSAASCR
jgi:SAM-dependent methyltransferase